MIKSVGMTERSGSRRSGAETLVSWDVKIFGGLDREFGIFQFLQQLILCKKLLYARVDTSDNQTDKKHTYRQVNTVRPIQIEMSADNAPPPENR